MKKERLVSFMTTKFYAIVSGALYLGTLIGLCGMVEEKMMPIYYVGYLIFLILILPRIKHKDTIVITSWFSVVSVLNIFLIWIYFPS